ncbi:MAG: cytochrome C biogenesis protein, partial [Myxococcales bacterium]|nr:cytochrome C biogenesis protein [Myxococcales bacterium]
MGSSNLLAHGYFFAFATMFVGGFLTSLTPCVYPLIPITVSLFGARGDDVPRSRAMTLAACYVGGIGVMYAALGV